MVGVACNFKALGLEAAFEGFFSFDQVDGHVAKDC